MTVPAFSDGRPRAGQPIEINRLSIFVIIEIPINRTDNSYVIFFKYRQHKTFRNHILEPIDMHIRTDNIQLGRGLIK